MARDMREWMEEREVPTWGIVLLVYGGWWGLMSAYHILPWWVVAPIAAYLLTLHSSLQHEGSHNRPAGPLVSSIVCYPPLTLWLPFPLYKKSHRMHHVNENLTDPTEDTESFYWRESLWVHLPAWRRKLLMLHQALLGRMVLGPIVMVANTYVKEWHRLRSGDRRHLRYWVTHMITVSAVLALVVGHFHVSVWEYVAVMVYPSLMLMLVRSFYEHRYDISVGARSVIMESNWFWRLLFMNNSYHAVHHDRPSLPWFVLKREYAGNKGLYDVMGKGFKFSGYGEWFKAFLLKPVYYPIHPEVEATHHLPPMRGDDMAILPMDQPHEAAIGLPEVAGAPKHDE